MDEALYRMSLEDDSDERPFVDKEVLYVQDQQNGVYNGQFTFDTSNLANSGRWQAWSEATIQMPFVATLTADQNITGAGVVNSFTMGLKNGHYQLVDSIKVDYNNTMVVQSQSFTNFFVNYKVMSSWGQDDLKKWGAICGVVPDGSTSRFSAVPADEDGLGNGNNRIAYPGGVKQFLNVLEFKNDGLEQRCHSNYDLTTANIGGLGGKLWMTKNQCNSVGKSYLDDDAGVGIARVWRLFIVATIRLKDMADFFDKLPLIKGGFMKIEVNFNSCDTVIPVTTGTSMGLTSVTVRAGRTNPIMVSSADVNQPNADLLAVAANPNLTITTGIGKSTGFTGTHPLLSTCRLYVPAYKLDEEKEAQLLSVNRVKEIIYQDFYQYQILSVTPGQSFNQILSNGVNDVQQVIVVPITNRVANGLGGSIESYQSPYDSSPSTTAPLASIANFNVLVGGRNVFSRDKQYDWEEYCDEVSRHNSVDGGVSTGLSSGLLSHKDWSYGYRFYVADVSRHPNYEDGSPKSIAVKGVNNTADTMDYICFITYNKRINIDISDGSLIVV